MENTLERIAKCRYKTKMDKHSGFWQVDPAAAAQELLAFITPKGPVFKWKVMPFGVANAPALFQELMNKVLYILRRRPLVQELISRGAEMEAHIDDVSLGTNTKEDHVLLLREFFIVCQGNQLRIKLKKCEFMREEMEYLGFDVGYGWWKPAASKMQPLQDMQIRDDPKKGLHDVRSFVGACMKVLPWVVDGAGGLGAGKTSGAGTRGVDLNAAIGGRTGDSNTNGGESSNNRSKIHVECYPAENPSL